MRSTIITLLLFTAIWPSCTKDSIPFFPLEIDQLKAELEQTFIALEDQVTFRSASVAGQTQDTARIRETLHTLVQDVPWMTLFGFVTPEGILQTVAPDTFASAEGTDIHEQDHVVRAFQTKQPYLSNVFQSAEGFPAAVDIYPLLQQGQLRGAITALFKPAELLAQMVEPKLEGQSFEIWIMGQDGTLLWDQDTEDIGRNLFTDPYYDGFPSLKTALELMKTRQRGETTYSFYAAGSQTEVTKHAFWDTFYHHGNAWKLVWVHLR